MPKIIENIRERLLEEAKRQIAENGYAKTTIRSVAAACGLGVGTVYNYFQSKDHLIATFMAEDWLQLIDKVNASAALGEEALLRSIFDALTEFTRRYQYLFCDKDAEKVFFTAFSERHRMLRHQLAEIICPLCREKNIANSEFTSEYIAESLLVWTIAGKSFDEQYEIISRLLK